ncbi:MAG TPA: hypothetical protein VF712_10315 [Thermoleophilaceae bacterium]|jgi:hypothetical protein
MALLNVFRGPRPDITAAQVIGAIAAAVGPVCQLVGIGLSPDQLKAVDDLKVIGLGLIGADAALRIGRNMREGRVRAAALAIPPEPPPAALAAPAFGEAPPEAAEMAFTEAPLEAAEIGGLGEEIGIDDLGEEIGIDDLGDEIDVGDLEDEALSIEEEELAGVPEEDES